MNAIKILAERSGKNGAIIVQKYPLNSGMTHRYVVKRVDLDTSRAKRRAWTTAATNTD